MNARKLVKLVIPGKIFEKLEPYGHLAEAVFWQAIYGFPARKMKVIGVTGTNGKTTTSFLIHRMLVDSGYKTGLMSTVAYGVDNDIHQQIHHMTNVPVPELVKRLKWMQRQNIDWLVLETTSHALAQNRVWGIPYSLAVFTNLTHEHISYHGSFARYREAKMRMFKIANQNRRGLQTGVINADDASAKYFASVIKNSVMYGIDRGDVRATKVNLALDHVSFEAKIGSEKYHLRCQIPGSFNVYNCLAAACVGQALGLTRSQIEQGIAALTGVEGRMTRIDEGQDFDVIVDYAHTPDSYEKLFKGLRPAVKGKMIVVFGSLGGGDLVKRAEQGRLAGEYCDEVVVCEEDDRDENPEKIMADIAAGVEKAGKTKGKDLFLIHDRTEAMRFAVRRAKTGDTVLFLGKGHEKTMEDAAGEHPWDEIASAHQALAEMR